MKSLPFFKEREIHALWTTIFSSTSGAFKVLTSCEVSYMNNVKNDSLYTVTVFPAIATDQFNFIGELIQDLQPGF